MCIAYISKKVGENMKYQVRITDIMSDKPVSKLYDTREEAEKKLEEVREEIKETWLTPSPECAYIFVTYGRNSVNHKNALK